MERILFMALLFCAFSIARAQNAEDTSLDPRQVPAVVVENFTKQFPNVTPAWHKDGAHYRVSYIDPQSKLGRVLVYDKEGSVVRTENEVDKAGLPTPIGDYYSDNYPGETYQVWSTDDKTGGRTLYFSNRNEETIYFDQNGKVMSQKKARSGIKKGGSKK